MFVMYFCLWWIFVWYVYIFVMYLCLLSMYLCLWCIYVCDVVFIWCVFVSDGIFVTKKNLFLCMYLIGFFHIVYYVVCFSCVAEQSVLCLFFVCLAEYSFVCLAEYSFVCSVCFTCFASFLMKCLYWYYGCSCVFKFPVLLFAFNIGFVWVVCICFPV